MPTTCEPCPGKSHATLMKRRSLGDTCALPGRTPGPRHHPAPVARDAEWTVLEPSGKRHRLRVGRSLLGLAVTLDRNTVRRFARSPDADRYVVSLAGHVLTVTVPRASSDQPGLAVDGRAVLGSETTLTQPEAGQAAAAATPVTGEDLARHQLVQRRDGGAAWFYWIGGGPIPHSPPLSGRTPLGLVVGPRGAYPVGRLAAAVQHTVRD